METDVDLEPSSPRRWARRLMVSGVVLIVGAGAWITIDELAGPDEVVERFLTAAQDRDVESALAEVLSATLEEIRTDDPDVFTEFGGEDAFLTPKAMRTDWDFGWITSGADGPVFEPGNENVSVEITGFGKTETAVFEVTETKDGWKLVDPFVDVSVPYTPLTFMDVNGFHAEDPAPEMFDPRPTFPVFPGTHRFFDDLPTGVDIADAGKLKVLLTQDRLNDEGEYGGYVPRLGELTLTGDLLDEARQSVASLIDTCAATEDPVPETSEGGHDNQGCPFELQPDFDIGDEHFHAHEGSPVTWDVTAPPTFEIVDVRAQDPDTAWALTGFEARPTKPGRFTVSGVAEGGYDTNRNLKYTLDCEFAPESIRGRLDSESRFVTRSLPEAESEIVTVNAKNDGCELEYEYLPKD